MPTNDCAGPEATAEAIVQHPKVCATFTELLGNFATASADSSMRVACLLLMAEPPSMDKDKGSINQRAVLKNRATLVDELYATPLSPRVISV